MVDKALAQMFTIVIVASTFMVDKAIVNHKAKPFAIKNSQINWLFKNLMQNGYV